MSEEKRVRRTAMILIAAILTLITLVALFAPHANAPPFGGAAFLWKQ